VIVSIFTMPTIKFLALGFLFPFIVYIPHYQSCDWFGNGSVSI